MRWFTIVLEEYEYNSELISHLFQSGISVARVYTGDKSLIIEVIVTSYIKNLKSHISNCLKMTNQECAIKYELFEGVRLKPNNVGLLYTGPHGSDETLTYFSEDAKTNISSVPRYIFSFHIFQYGVLFLISILLLIYGIYTGIVFTSVIGIIISYLLYKTIISFAFILDLKEDYFEVTGIFGRKRIMYSNIFSILIRMERGNWATVETSNGTIKFPVGGLFAIHNERQIISTLINRAHLELYSGINHLACEFKPIASYLNLD